MATLWRGEWDGIPSLESDFRLYSCSYQPVMWTNLPTLVPPGAFDNHIFLFYYVYWAQLIKRSFTKWLEEQLPLRPGSHWCDFKATWVAQTCMTLEITLISVEPVQINAAQLQLLGRVLCYFCAMQCDFVSHGLKWKHIRNISRMHRLWCESGVLFPPTILLLQESVLWKSCQKCLKNTSKPHQVILQLHYT